MRLCNTCGREVPEGNRFCTNCGTAVAQPAGEDQKRPAGAAPGAETEEMNMPVLYLMVGLLVLAGLFPPWETAPGQPPEFLGFHFILTPPEDAAGRTAVISRLLITIELVTIAIAGFYFSWLFRKNG
ncbi:MAG: zinc ribbon domain-containing protein [Nitrospira sp.]|nr:zinc ribbon domain-containing protein [Nitrospira sp.]